MDWGRMIFLCMFLLYILSFHNRGSNVPLMTLQETDCQDSCQNFSFEQPAVLHEYFDLKIKYCSSELGIPESLSNVRIRHARASNVMPEGQVLWSRNVMKILTVNTAPTAEASSSSCNTKNTHRWKISNEPSLKKTPNVEGTLPIQTNSWWMRFAHWETSTATDATNK